MYGSVGQSVCCPPICCPPVCCPPEYCVRDYYTQRIIPVIHPIVNINRHNIVNVPQHYYQPMTTNVVADQGYQGYQGNPGYAGYSNRLFFR